MTKDEITILHIGNIFEYNLIPFQTEIVNLRLPRFRIGSDVGSVIEDSLKAIGLTDVFDEDNSDLTLMSPKDSLSLTSIAHR